MFNERNRRLPVIPTSRQGTNHVIVDGDTAGALAEERHAIGIAAEAHDVLVDPAYRLGLVFHAHVARQYEILGAQESEWSQSGRVSFAFFYDTPVVRIISARFALRAYLRLREFLPTGFYNNLCGIRKCVLDMIIGLTRITSNCNDYFQLFGQFTCLARNENVYLIDELGKHHF